MMSQDNARTIKRLTVGGWVAMVVGAGIGFWPLNPDIPVCGTVWFTGPGRCYVLRPVGLLILSLLFFFVGVIALFVALTIRIQRLEQRDTVPHYFASLLIASGLDVKVVQNRLRHASAKTTLDTYSHMWPDKDESARAAVANVLAARAKQQLGNHAG
jgi:hypothetical protein